MKRRKKLIQTLRHTFTSEVYVRNLKQKSFNLTLFGEKRAVSLRKN